MKILKRIRKIEIKTRVLAEGLLQGAYHSIFKGRGIEFSEVREYTMEDDVRSIDWNVTARMNHPYVKEYIEERDMNMMFVFDISRSADFGSTKAKRETAVEMAASLAFAAMRNNDNVGLVLFSGAVEKYIPLRKGKRHVLRIIREMLYHRPKNSGTDIAKALGFVSNVCKKKGIIFLISDFMADSAYQKQLRILRRRHDVIALNIGDIREQDIPDIGYIELEDAESGEQMLVNTSDKEFRKNYVRLVRQQRNSWKKMMARVGIDTIQLLSGEAFDVPLRKFFAMRLRR